MTKPIKICRFCGEVFIGKRADAKFCSNSCRVLNARAKKHKTHQQPKWRTA